MHFLLRFLTPMIYIGAASAVTLSFSQRQYGPVTYSQPFAVGGTGTISTGGCMTVSDPINICGNGNIHALVLSNTQNADGSYSPTTTAPAQVLFYYVGYSNNASNAVPGVYTMTYGPITSTGFTATPTLQLTIIANTLPTMTTYNGALTGCFTSDANYFVVKDTCPTITPGFPGNADFALPARGSSYNDPNFGTPITVLTPLQFGSAGRTIYADSTNTAYNADHSLVLTESVSGHIYATSTTTGVDTWDLGGFPCPGDIQWSSTNPLQVFCQVTPLDYSTVTLITPPSTWSSVTTLYTFTGNATKITDGGDGGASRNNFGCWGSDSAAAGSARVMGLINFATGASYTADYSTLPTTSFACYTNTSQGPPPCIRACTVSKGPDVATGYMSVVASIDPGTAGGPAANYLWEWRWKPGDTSLTSVGPMGMNPESVFRGVNSGLTSSTFGQHCSAFGAMNNMCMATGHDSSVEIGGHEYWFKTELLISAQPTVRAVTLHRLDYPDLTYTAAEIGGAMTVVATVGINSSPFTAALSHSPCAKFAPVCAFELTNDPQLSSWFVNTASGNGVTPIHITATRSASVWPNTTISNGDVLLFGGLNGNTALNKLTCTVANVVGGTTTTPAFDCTGTTGNGAYVSGGAFVKNQDPSVAPSNPYQGEIVVADFTNFPATILRRIAKHRSWEITGPNVSYYYGQAHPAISPDGTLVAWESNYGHVEELGIFQAPTGYVGPSLGSTFIGGVFQGVILR